MKSVFGKQSDRDFENKIQCVKNLWCGRRFIPLKSVHTELSDSDTEK